LESLEPSYYPKSTNVITKHHGQILIPPLAASTPTAEATTAEATTAEATTAEAIAMPAVETTKELA